MSALDRGGIQQSGEPQKPKRGGGGGKGCLSS